MKVVGLIAEYNPFHNGHLYHLLESKKITKSDYSIAVMSGNFLQRGEPALVDKWTRAKMAIDNGIDLVIELPLIYACQSAEFFAFGSVKILDSLGIINSICFGSESGDIQSLDYIAEILYEEPEAYKKYLKSHLDQGLSYPKAREQALTKYLKEFADLDFSNIEEIISSPNNILSIEYLKSLKKIKSNIRPFTLKRIKSNYHDKKLTGTISSATAIREQLIRNPVLENIKHTVPEATYTHLVNFYKEHNGFNSLENYSIILLYLLRNSSSSILKNIVDVTEGLDNRIIDCSSKYNDISDILECVNTKRYTITRLRRILIHLLLNIDKKNINFLQSYGPQYIRVLGANTNGIYLLKEMKKTCSLPIITKFADYKKFNNDILNKMIEIDKKATDIYSLGLNKGKMNLDYLTSPYIIST